MEKNTTIKYFPVYDNNIFIGLQFFFGAVGYILLNVYLNCDYITFISLKKYKENLAEIAIFTEEYDEVIISGEFNSDPNKGR